jgi:poly(3-hydroxybutyrate) depolymerase
LVLGGLPYERRSHDVERCSVAFSSTFFRRGRHYPEAMVSLFRPAITLAGNVVVLSALLAGCGRGSEGGAVDGGTGGFSGANPIATGGGGAVATGSGGNASKGNGGTQNTTSSGGAPISQAGAANNAGSAGTAGTRGTAGTTSPDAGSPSADAGRRTPLGHSVGCSKKQPASDSSNDFVEHDVTVTGVDPAFVSAHPPQGGSWSARSYYVRLPAGYDSAKAYPLSIGGGGCGNTDGTSGSSGGLSALPKGEKDAIQVGLNYMYPQGAGACFADDFVNTPDLPYFDSVLAELESNYCVDRDRVFVDGFSSGAWETYLLGCARAGIVRGIGTAEGGLRMARPACAQTPVAAILVAGLQDTENPIGPLMPPGKNDSLGSAPARDDILARNGCVGTTTTPWDPAYPACVKYTGCPADYPVVWCAIDAGHTDGGNISSTGFWKFWSALPSP